MEGNLSTVNYLWKSVSKLKIEYANVDIIKPCRNTSFIMRSFILIMMLMSFSGCVTLKTLPETATHVQVSEDVYFDLLPARLFPQNLNVTQLVDISFKDQQHSFIVQMEINATEDSLKLVGLTRFGIKVFDLTWKAGKMNYWIHDNAPEVFSPSFLLADIQLALWPINHIESHLSGEGVKLQHDESEPSNRILRKSGSEILRIHFLKNEQGLDSLKYEHLYRQYSISVDTLSIESL